MLSSMTSGELRHESRDRHSLGRILKVPPRSAASGRPSRSWKAPSTYSLERLRYVAHAFQRAGSGGFPAARWRYCQDAPLRPDWQFFCLTFSDGPQKACHLVGVRMRAMPILAQVLGSDAWSELHAPGNRDA